MFKPKYSVYRTMYSILLVLLVTFFMPHLFAGLDYNVMRINEEYNLFGVTFRVNDIFPLRSFPDDELHYMSIGTYISTICCRLTSFALTCAVFKLVQVLNMFLADIPGRAFVRIPKLILMFLFLYGFELLDFVLFAGGTDWVFLLLFTSITLLVLCTVKMKKNAGH